MKRFGDTSHWIAGLGCLLSIVGAYYSFELYRNLHTEFEQLLPKQARAVIDLEKVSNRIQSLDNLAVLVYSNDVTQSKKFVTDLADKLAQEPKSEIASIEYRIDRELKFFRDRKALYLSVPQLKAIRNYVEDRIDYESTLANPLTIFENLKIPAPKLDLHTLSKNYETRMSAFGRYPGGYYASPDQKKRVVLVYLPSGQSGIDSRVNLKNKVSSMIARMDPRSYAPDLVIKYAGGVEEMIEEHSALVADLMTSAVIVVCLVAVSLLVFFRSFRATSALLASVFAGSFWTFGLCYFLVGSLNANSAFLGSIVLGNGINFGIIYLARYLEHRRRGFDHAVAARYSSSNTLTSTCTAALAAGLSYGSLILTGFRGFWQFGIIGLIGMMMCWASAYTFLPAILGLLDRRRPLIHPFKRKPTFPFSHLAAWLVGRHPGWVWLVSSGLTIASVALLTGLNSHVLETDLSHLRNRESLTSGAVFLSRDLDDIFRRYLTPVVVLPQQRKDSRAIANRLLSLKSPLIAAVQTLDDFIPTEQSRKIGILKDIQKLLRPGIVRKLSAKDRALINGFLNSHVLRPIREKDLPPLVLDKFTEKDGTVGKMVLVEPPLGKGIWEEDNLIGFVRTVRSTADSVRPGTPVAGTLAITAAMFEAVKRDGPRATLFALCAVSILVVFLFRKLRSVIPVLLALYLGVLWLAGFILAFKIKINFLNFIALPITFGIGVDYGVNIYQRYRQEGGEHILEIVRNTGGAVALCSLTTIIGYTSLLLARNQGFVSFGRLAVAGELTCISAAIFSMPSLLLLMERANRRRLSKLHGPSQPVETLNGRKVS